MHRTSKCARIARNRHTSGLYSLCCPFRSYFKDGLQTIAHFGTYIDDLSAKLTSIKQKQDDERRRLLELKTLLRSTPDFERVEVGTTAHIPIHPY